MVQRIGLRLVNDYQFRIAAIVPVYNVKRYLRQCVESLLNQAYPLKEIILVDDGSTDGSGILCDELANENAIVRVLHKQNAGLGYARNTGLDNTSDDIDYVTFVDSDDWVEPDMVSTLVRALKSNKADCALAGFTKRDNNGHELFRFQLENAVYDDSQRDVSLTPRICGSAPGKSDSIPMSACAALFSKACIDNNSLRFPSEREVLSEDFFFKYQYLCHAGRVCTSECVGYSYRTNDHSLSRSYLPNRFEASLHFYNLACNLVSARPAEKECVRRLQKTTFINVRVAIAQESIPQSGKTAKEAKDTIRAMCASKQLQKIIAEYPVHELSWKQRMFVELLRTGEAGVLYALGRHGAF